MDLGIAGKWALVCAASKGLGKGCAKALVAEGVNVVVTARGAEALNATADELRALGGGQVRAVAGDITTAEGRAAALTACPQIDILVNNAGGPPPGDFRDWDREAWIKALDANMLTPIELIKAVADPMAARGFGRIVNITSGAVKAPIDILGLSNGARSGLTGFIAGLARQSRLVSRNVTINNMLPGAVRHRSAALDHGRRRAEKRQEPRRRDGRAARSRIRRIASARPKSSAPCAPSCAACTPATSPARTCCSTAGPIRARSSSRGCNACYARKQSHGRAACSPSLRRSALRADSTAMLGPGSRRRTHYVLDRGTARCGPRARITPRRARNGARGESQARCLRFAFSPPRTCGACKDALGRRAQRLCGDEQRRGSGPRAQRAS